MSKKINKYAENACEYETMLLLAQELQSSGFTLKTPVSKFILLRDSYVNSTNSSLNAKEKNSFKLQISERLPLCKAAATSIKDSYIAMYGSPSYEIDIIPWNKLGLKQGVSQKSDINIDVYEDGTLINTREISLKLYNSKNAMGKLSIQVASGTFLSTVCGLAFDVVGRGSFVTSTGEKFNSKKANMSVIKNNFVKEYGPKTQDPLTRLEQITKETHKLRTEEYIPDNIDEIRKNTGNSATQPFIEVLSLVDLKDRILTRTGLKTSSSKELVAVCFAAGDKTQVFSSIGNKKYHSNIDKLNSNSCKLQISESGQGVGFTFVDDKKNELLFFNMPLTININGAWANEDRYDKLDKCFYKKGQRRVKKSQQLDTSTNVWVDIGQIF